MSKRITCKGCKARFLRASGTRRLYCETCRPPRVLATDGIAAPAVVEQPAPRPPGPIELTTVAELQAAGRLATVSGRIAVRLAHQMDDEQLSGSQVATLGAQLERTMDRATAGAPKPPDVVDEIAARIAAKRAAAGGAA